VVEFHLVPAVDVCCLPYLGVPAKVRFYLRPVLGMVSLFCVVVRATRHALIPFGNRGEETPDCKGSTGEWTPAEWKDTMVAGLGIG